MKMNHSQYKHGMSQSPTHRTWTRMRERCLCRTKHNYYRYGGRGIKICKRWDKFYNFLDDMGVRPPGMTIERKNNNGPYSPANCEWVSVPMQAQNRRDVYRITFKGKSQSIKAWARELHISPMGLKARLDAGWSKKKALTTPPDPKAIKRGKASIASQGKYAFMIRSRKVWGKKQGKKNYLAHKKRW